MDSTPLAQPLVVDTDNKTPKHDLENGASTADTIEEHPAKKPRLENAPVTEKEEADAAPKRVKGIAPVKAEFIVQKSARPQPVEADNTVDADDAAEAASHQQRESEQKGKKKTSGQNKGRDFGQHNDAKGLCPSRAFSPEFSPKECKFGDRCRFEHDVRTYLKEHKRADLTTFGGICPLWEAKGRCPYGYKCRFVGSHMTERETADGRKELVLVEDETRKKAQPLVPHASEDGIVNAVSMEDKVAVARRKIKTPRSDAYLTWLDKTSKALEKNLHGRHFDDDAEGEVGADVKVSLEDVRAAYVEPPFLPSEKRRLYFGPETPALAPLTTQGNLPFRRLCTDLGAQFTYSEMAMGMSLIQGQKSEWALMKAHETEAIPPTISSGANIVQGYDNSQDLKFGAQIAANKPWHAIKATELLGRLTPHLRVIDLNCGCPIDQVYRDGAGSALLDHQSKLEKILRGMNAVSEAIPITVKIRTGTRDASPNALKLIERLTLGGHESSMLNIGPPGVAAITLHGRTRQQRYTKQADWSYIAECAALIKRLNEKTDEVTDTVREPDARTLPNGGKVYFLGNGDCYSHKDYEDHINNAGVDAVMVGRGAIIKPWVFEEIQTGQYLDKTATERLAYVEKFAKYGLDTWGSDEHGVGTTRRFMLEWLSFTQRYVPIGLLDYLPPNIQDRPPAWRGRNELETLLGSPNYKDWIKITEMFLGPAHKDFKFEPKHKSNAYEPQG
ncbi:tRNA dihydrouridine synthase DUS3 [Aspergillus clavatus NRRL 1]|uniref:tRNA-dihydrouridine(47) synthase [NAD(P)(+)] n=1 Tax=Aspergillus clavatus (strain ATCC 1007 / CBS 513.65 / DSM 816 / NCTC 3887 / NRRL 1 / QM 1276 / 107) TaxID=344612 RepID=DUS3_ASPCL|nr:tRNA dihydrouridine synthase, putative [Aspergillus clavatus NRRL 1]A1CNY3.1 RecName: Full=tRNA-dihydrouridine(47) synthase [NAD(P)(+)]; AltName: Full=mRNA-dihydrouridine synthase dus3; AltName: Full=tRNA-dihydrouridine synthase 3 [Aspergillus clavatus NRRL 1]EAW07354.1 tRNA dihydrouridine synthase, putative [Aspergillus clavatus NRRL 1]